VKNYFGYIYFSLPNHIIDEGTEGKVRTKQKLTPPNPPPHICDIPHALLAALKLRKEKTNS